MKYLTKELKKTKNVVLHSHGYKADFHGLAAAKLSRIPVITTVHGYTTENSKVALYESVQKRLLPCFRQVICVTDYYKEFILRETGIKNGKVITIYNGIKLEAYKEARSDYYERHYLNQRERQPYYIGIVGRLSKEKGHDKLLDIMEALVSSGVEIRCYIVGDGELRGNLESMVNEKGLTASVVFTGHVQNPVELYMLFDLLFITSIKEGLPNVALEAIAIGIPVVSFDICGIKEIIREGVNGVLVKSFDIQEFAFKAKELLGDVNKRRFFADNAYEIVKEKFTFEKRMKKIIDIYESFLG